MEYVYYVIMEVQLDCSVIHCAKLDSLSIHKSCMINVMLCTLYNVTLLFLMDSWSILKNLQTSNLNTSDVYFDI